MNNWVLFSHRGNPSSDITKLWLKNHAIPHEERSIYTIQKEEIERLAKIVPGGARALAYPDTFSFIMINPQRKADQSYIEQIRNNELSESQMIELFASQPYLMITPILTNFEKVIIGYQYDEMVSTFRFIKVKDVHMA
jgi:arsenate reductase-like glutaredoxin family protein